MSMKFFTVVFVAWSAPQTSAVDVSKNANRQCNQDDDLLSDSDCVLSLMQQQATLLRREVTLDIAHAERLYSGDPHGKQFTEEEIADMKAAGMAPKSKEDIARAERLEEEIADMKAAGKLPKSQESIIQAEGSYGGDSLIGTASLLNETSGCNDHPGWYDSDGPRYNCNWYSFGRRCQYYGNGYHNKGRTANQACCSCGGGSGSHGHADQYYAYAHRCLEIADMEQALADDCNAIEIDTYAWWDHCTDSDWETGGCWWAQHDDAIGAYGDRMDKMLAWIANNAKGKVSSVMIDIKNPDYCDPDDSYYKQCSVKMLHELVNRYLKSDFNVVYDVYSNFDSSGYKWFVAGNLNKCYQTVDAELEHGHIPSDANWNGLPKALTYGHSLPGFGWCSALEEQYWVSKAKIAAHWTVTKPSQVVEDCGNAIILGWTMYHYDKWGTSWKSVVDKAKEVAAHRGFDYVRNAVSWC